MEGRRRAGRGRRVLLLRGREQLHQRDQVRDAGGAAVQRHGRLDQARRGEAAPEVGVQQRRAPERRRRHVGDWSVERGAFVARHVCLSHARVVSYVYLCLRSMERRQSRAVPTAPFLF